MQGIRREDRPKITSFRHRRPQSNRPPFGNQLAYISLTKRREHVRPDHVQLRDDRGAAENPSRRRPRLPTSQTITVLIGSYLRYQDLGVSVP